jgi:hypothetical protein
VNDWIATTRIRHGGSVFDVCTINRACSAIGASELIYAETIVFSLDVNGMSTGISYQTESPRGSLRKHFDAVQRIHETGSPEEPEDEQ